MINVLIPVRLRGNGGISNVAALRQAQGLRLAQEGIYVIRGIRRRRLDRCIKMPGMDVGIGADRELRGKGQLMGQPGNTVMEMEMASSREMAAISPIQSRALLYIMKSRKCSPNKRKVKQRMWQVKKIQELQVVEVEAAGMWQQQERRLMICWLS
jgi:hypothetical protein